MINLISEVFAFNWYRFTIPGVIAGLVMIVVGMIILIMSSRLAAVVNAKIVKSGKTEKINMKYVFYAVAGVLIVTGALLAIFMAE